MSSQSSIAIPSSTVVAIGGGFVGLALAVLFTLFMFRVTRLKLEARHRRRAGEQVTFHEIWDRDGGMWGFLTGIGGDSGLVGAGGRPDLTLTRLRNEIRLWEFYKAQNKAEMVRPKMWEVEVEEKGVMRGQEALVLDSSLVSRHQGRECSPLTLRSPSELCLPNRRTMWNTMMQSTTCSNRPSPSQRWYCIPLSRVVGSEQQTRKIGWIFQRW